jgi:hypothetical protein
LGILLSRIVKRDVGAIGAVVDVDIEKKDWSGRIFGRYISRAHFAEEIKDVEANGVIRIQNSY